MIENTVFLKNQNKILELLATQEPLDKILRSITQTIETQLPNVRCSILKANEEGTHLLAGDITSLSEDLQFLLQHGVKISPKNGSCGSAAFFREAVAVEDIESSPLWGGRFKEQTLANGLLACWSTPIINPSNKVLGTFAIYYDQKRGPSVEESRLLSLAGHLAGLALEQERTRIERNQYNKQLEEQVLKRTHELQEAVEVAKKANEAKSRFLSRMSHELRTPLNAILGFGQILKMDNDGLLNDSYLDSLDHILKAGDHLLSLINEILDLAKIESEQFDLNFETLDLRECVEGIVQLTEPLAKAKQITVQVQHPQTPCVRLNTDRVRLKQILLNLISNGIKYNNAGGRLIISFSRTPANMLRLDIEDTGPGIPEEFLDQIFEPFRRLDNRASSPEGTGVGLTISRQLAQLMGGTLVASSQLGCGTCMTLELPALD